MEYLKHSFSDYLATISNDVKINVLCSALVFPRTRSLQDKAVSTCQIDETDLLKTNRGLEINWGELKRKVAMDAELIGIDAVNDLTCILNLLQEVEPTLKLAVFDGFVIYRGGIDLLRIQIGDRNDSRSAYVEINDYRRQINTFFVKQEQQSTQQFRDWMMVLIFLAIMIHTCVSGYSYFK